MSQLYTHNTNFFEVPDNINCYYAGLLAADGCISSTKYSRYLSLEPAIRDSELVYRLRSALEYTGPIYEYQHRKTAALVVCSKSLIYDLEGNFNLSERKSLTLEPPNIKDEKMLSGYIRGYSDGDGSIIYNKYGNTWQYKIMGTNKILAWINSVFKQYAARYWWQDQCPKRQGNAYYITYRGKIALRILDWLYQDSTESTRLSRKYNKYRYMHHYYENRKEASQYRGVTFNKAKNHWRANLKHKGRSYYLGSFENEIEAAKAYNTQLISFGITDRHNII